METSPPVWKKESGGNCVWHDEAEIHRESEFTKIQRAATRGIVQSGPSQHRTTELPRVCWEVTFHTVPVGMVYI